MSETQLSSLFQDGAQFNVNELQAGQGSGLGLYISKGMAEQHGGSLVATSDGLGLGTTFTLSLPLYWVPPEESEEQSPGNDSCEMTATMTSTALAPGYGFQLDSSVEQDVENQCGRANPMPGSPKEGSRGSAGIHENLPSLRILVVDDVKSNRRLIARLARNRHHIVEEAFDGQDALDKVRAALEESTSVAETGEDERSSSYDVILMDYEMPRMNGPTAVREMRKLGCEALIVGVTGNVLAEDVKHFVNNGANEVLPKPVKFAKLEQIWMESSLVD